MRTVILKRDTSTPEGTFGTVTTDWGLILCSGELPWCDNFARFSCIPAGQYICDWKFSPKHGNCYHVQEVPGRSEIEIHSANFVGDSRLGLKCQLEGCITLGTSIGELEHQKALLESRKAILEFEENLQREDFQLTIIPVEE